MKRTIERPRIKVVQGPYRAITVEAPKMSKAPARAITVEAPKMTPERQAAQDRIMEEAVKHRARRLAAKKRT